LVKLTSSDIHKIKELIIFLLEESNEMMVWIKHNYLNKTIYYL